MASPSSPTPPPARGPLSRRALLAGIAPLVPLARLADLSRLTDDLCSGLHKYGRRPGEAGLQPAEARPESVCRADADLLIRGGRVVNADGVVRADVRIRGATIAEVGPGLRAEPTERIIEARGRLLMPGGIDPHTHLHPGFADDLTTGSRAALAGGITTVGSFLFPNGEEAPDAVLDRFVATASREAIADVFGHFYYWPPEKLLEAIPTIAARGQPSFKLYMVQDDFAARLPVLVRALEAARDAGVVALVHCEDATLLDAAARHLAAQGRTSLAWYPESRPVVAELAATQQAMALCESTRAPMHVVHLSSARALDATRATKKAGLPLSIETRPLYLHLTEERFRAAGPEAPLFVGQPPLRQPADREALWRGLAAGEIDLLATDHAPWTRAQKLDPALTITNLRPGVSDLQFMLPMFFSEGVVKRKLPLERFVALTATAAARRFGLYPRKGVIQAGSDADIAIWDPTRRGQVTAAADHSNADYSPYEGWSVTGWPMTVIRRGEIVVDGGQILGAAGSGQVVRRAAARPTG
ncbi:MAG: amidohydrolase family protein [Gemmatimonadetes bacterium]|nr:amidohydrolase family protein [Gemmatimonadota bacterium]